MASTTLIAVVAAAAALVFWLVRQNSQLRSVPPEVARYSPKRWTKAEIQETYDRLVKKPLDFGPSLPPKLDRRYIVVGGFGLVGGDTVLQLLQRGQSPESIRIVDFAAKPTRPVMLRHPDLARVSVVRADIADAASTKAAFAAPWPASVASLPLTVFHTAAVIRPYERSPIFYPRVSRVNVDGAAHVLRAAQDAGADILIATSSGSVALQPCGFWAAPWHASPHRYAQFYDESDFDRPLRPANDFFSNYALSKAQAERIVCGANRPGFRTGTIRPVNGVYGDPADLVVGSLLRMPVVSWTPHVVQNFVAARNVALGHLAFEAALARDTKSTTTMPTCAGRAYNVTDGGVAPAFADLYAAFTQASDYEMVLSYPPPILLFLVGQALEAWCLLLAHVPWLTRLGLADPAYPTCYLQPAVFTVTAHTIGTDAAARKSVADGGIGYVPGCTTIEGMLDQVRAWNEDSRGRDPAELGIKVKGKVAKAVVAAGLAPEPVAA